MPAIVALPQVVAELLRGLVVLTTQVEDPELFVGRQRHDDFFLGSVSATTAKGKRDCHRNVTPGRLTA